MTQTDLVMDALSMWALIIIVAALVVNAIIIYGEWKR